MTEEYVETEEYTAEFTYEDPNKKGFSFPLLGVNNFEEAAVNAVEEIKTRGIITENSMTGEIKNSKGECYEIFKKDWLIDTKTGKKPDSLEGKLD